MLSDLKSLSIQQPGGFPIEAFGKTDLEESTKNGLLEEERFEWWNCGRTGIVECWNIGMVICKSPVFAPFPLLRYVTCSFMMMLFPSRFSIAHLFQPPCSATDDMAKSFCNRNHRGS